MAKKTLFAVSLIISGLVIGFLVLSAYTLSGGKTSVSILFLTGAVILIILGTILAFSRLLDKTVSPVVEVISGDIQDDLQDIKEHRMTNTIWMVVLVAIGFLIFSFFVFRFHKMEAAWGPIPVMIPTFFGLLALAYYIPRTDWFQRSKDYTPMWIFLIPAVGFIITLGVGLARTENMAILSGSSGEVVQYNIARSAGPFLQSAGGLGELGLDFDLPDCDGDGCAVLLVVGLVVLVFVMIIGSAMIPHFWLLSGSILLGIMLLIMIHDLRIRPGTRKHLRGKPKPKDDVTPLELPQHDSS